MKRFSIVLLVIVSATSAHASPLLHFKLEARLKDGSDPFASNVAVSLGDVLEYRLRLKLAPSGTTNQHVGTAGAMPGKHGLNSMSAAIVQDAEAPIQVDFNLPVELKTDPVFSARDWDKGVGARGGEPSPRAGLPWHDIVDIRPIHAPGKFSGAFEETVFSGQFNVAAISGLSSEVRALWGEISGGGWFDGNLFFVTGPNWTASTLRTEASSDPIADFAPLTLTAASATLVPEPSAVVLGIPPRIFEAVSATPVPEPSAVVLASIGLTALVLLRRRIARAG